MGVPIIRILIVWGLYLGPLILGNYHIIKWEVEAVGCSVWALGFTDNGNERIVMRVEAGLKMQILQTIKTNGASNRN